LATLAGRRQVLIVNAHSVAGHDPTDGRRLWQYQWPGAHPKASQPLPLPSDRLFVTAGYGVGCVMLRLNTDADGQLTAEELWANRNMKCKFSNLAVLDGYAYGLDDGIMACIDLETGSRPWKRGRFGHGQVLLVGDTLLVLSEDGQLVMLDATTEGYRELGRIQAVEGKTWNNPALAGRFLLLRNSKEAVCYELTLADDSSASDSP
jgi:outer membrane protein assembly factor BamB